MAKKATWSTITPAVSIDADGTLTASVPIKDGTKLAATLRFTITSARALRVDVLNAPGATGLTDFAAWTDR